MKYFNILFDSIVDGNKDLMVNTLRPYGVEELRMVDINELHVDENQNYYSFTITGQYMESLVATLKCLPIHHHVKTLMRNHNNVYWVLLAEHESDADNIVEIVESYCREENLPTKQIILINGNQKIKKIITNSNSEIRGHTSNRLPNVAVTGMNNFKYEFKKEKESFFMCYNRMNKPHRIGLLVLLKRAGLLDDIDWTLLRANEIKPNYTNVDGSISTNLLDVRIKDSKKYSVFTIEDFNEHIKEIEYFYNLDSKKSRFETSYKIDEPPFFIDFYKTYEMNPYSHSYVNIVTETNYVSNDVIHITEKSLIPCYYSQIPLILGNYEHNKFLKERYDLDLFEDIVDYSYDNVMVPRDRLFMFVDEVKRINSNKEFIIEFYKNNQERFEENKKKIINILEDKTDYNFFKSLI